MKLTYRLSTANTFSLLVVQQLTIDLTKVKVKVPGSGAQIWKFCNLDPNRNFFIKSILYPRRMRKCKIMDSNISNPHPKPPT